MARDIKKLIDENRIDVTFLKGDREVTFYYSEDLWDAKTRFQWRYGYWPDDTSIVKSVPSSGPMGE